MFWWNLYGGSSSVSPYDDEEGADGEEEGGRSSYDIADESKETQARSSQRNIIADARRASQRSIMADARDTRVAPSVDDLDPAVTAAILTQAAFRGYRLRHRLRGLPAREAERTIRALHANARGFRRIGLFLVFVALFFSLVFSGADVAFQRTVHQGLGNHLAMAKYGPEGDRTHADVTSLSEVYQWMQAFYLRTYHGTELEDRCTACAIKPPDDVCNACNSVVGSSSSSNSKNNSGSSNDSGSVGVGSGGRIVGLSEECEACLVGRICTGLYLENCAASLGLDSTSTSSPDQGDGDSAGDVHSASSSGSSASNASDELTINATALDAIVLEPVGGVSAARGHLVIENVSQCSNFDVTMGVTENVARYNSNLSVFFNRMGLVADRNVIIGGMLITFSRRMRLSEETCAASRGYFDVCLADKEDKELILPGGAWAELRPDKEVVYIEVAGGYPILIDTGGYNTGLNRGLCGLLVMEDLDIIPPEEVKSVSVQLVTYNGNQKTAFGSIFVEFSFEDGGKVSVSETITAYVLKRNTEGSSFRRRPISVVVFLGLFLGMAWHDTSKWWRVRRSKTQQGNPRHCVCGFAFFVLIGANIALSLVWGIGFSGTIMVGTDDDVGEIPNIDSLAQEVVALYRVALFVSTYYFVFLLTAMAGLYRWIFQMLTFHKRMSIVADTLSGACTHLQHFLFVAFLVALVFTNLTWFLVGRRFEDFSTTAKAWRSVIRVSLGEYDTFYSQILEAQPTVGPVIVVVYQVLGVVLLLNVVIAVLLEAYAVVVIGMKDEDTVFQSLAAFVGMTLCEGKARIQWANAYSRWWLSGGKSRHERRPSYKLSLQGPNSVCGVDGRPVLVIRRSSGSSLTPPRRQLSFNCPRYISVTDMQVLIEAAPVPAFVADRLVRKIVNKWIFASKERTPKDTSAPHCSGNHGDHGSSSGDGSTDSIPTLRRRDSSLQSASQ